MNIIINPDKAQYATLLARPHHDASDLNSIVAQVLADIRQNGDEAIRRYELKFDKVQLDDLAVSLAEMTEASDLVTPELRNAIQQAHDNIARFHQAQQMSPIRVETQPGVEC